MGEAERKGGLKGKVFIENKRQRSGVLGGTVRGGAVLGRSRRTFKRKEGSNTEKEVTE